jgi:hypothetical protein
VPEDGFGSLASLPAGREHVRLSPMTGPSITRSAVPPGGRLRDDGMGLFRNRETPGEEGERRFFLTGEVGLQKGSSPEWAETRANVLVMAVVQVTRGSGRDAPRAPAQRGRANSRSFRPHTRPRPLCTADMP